MESGHMGGITVEEEAGNMSQICLIFFLLKKDANWFAKDFSN